MNYPWVFAHFLVLTRLLNNKYISGIFFLFKIFADWSTLKYQYQSDFHSFIEAVWMKGYIFEKHKFIFQKYWLSSTHLDCLVIGLWFYRQEKKYNSLSTTKTFQYWQGVTSVLNTLLNSCLNSTIYSGSIKKKIMVIIVI